MPVTPHDFDNQMKSFLRAHQIAEARLTEDQMARALVEALASGDFIKHVRVTDNAQAVIYIPYARSQELESRISRLKSALDENGISDPDYP